jgi:hypothetical protein
MTVATQPYVSPPFASIAARLTWPLQTRFPHDVVSNAETAARRTFFAMRYVKFRRNRGVGEITMSGKPDHEESERERRTTNIVLLVAGILIVGGGIWLVNALVDARKAEECFESGRRNCAPIDLPERTRD